MILQWYSQHNGQATLRMCNVQYSQRNNVLLELSTKYEFNTVHGWSPRSRGASTFSNV
jgi:hypothetical protein